MTDQEYINNLTIWCSYHKDELIDKYNLNYIPSYIKLFNTNNLNIDGEHINHLNKSLAEICTYYYVWKNQIYSEYVGFCHYRRFFSLLGKNCISKYGIYVYEILEKDLNDELLNLFNTKNNLFEYLKKINICDQQLLYDYFYNNKSIILPWKISGIFKWDIFNKICDIFFGFLEYEYPDFVKTMDTNNRMIGYTTEYIFGIICTLLINKIDNSFFESSENIDQVGRNDWPILYTESDNVEDIILWCNKNNRVNRLYTILTNIDKLYDNRIYYVSKTNDLSNETNYRIGDCSYLTLIHSKNEIDQNCNYIKLNINEYIKCLDPIEFDKGNYTIEKF